MDKTELEFTNKLLKVIVALLLRGKSEEALNLRERVEFLSEVGLRPAEIAEILGRTSSYVNKELSGIRKARRK
jgi:DNA-binding CsgD family transcriptional regulator